MNGSLPCRVLGGDNTGNPRERMTFRINLQCIEPAKGRAITPQPGSDEFLLRTTEDIDGNCWCAQFTEKVSKRMQDDRGYFQLGRQLHDLRAGALSNQIRGTFI